ncbi:MAG: LuxR C-terminal-related transcriptional regulator, partial [Catenulispora sp.]
ALALLRRLEAAATGEGRTGSVIEIQALRALALSGLGEDAEALDVLAGALILGHEQGYVRVFADEGAPMRALITAVSTDRAGRQHRAGAVDAGYHTRLLRAFEPADAGVPAVAGPDGRAAAAPPQHLPFAAVESLTDRELQVLRLLAAGSSNERIAHDLFVALDTVKKHVTHILRKLGAANRTEAAARARHLGLIP